MTPLSRDPRYLSLLLAHQIRRTRARDRAAAYAIGLTGYLPARGHLLGLAELAQQAAEQVEEDEKDTAVLRLVTMSAYIAMQAMETKKKRLREIIGIVREGVDSLEYKRSLLIEAENIKEEIAALAEAMEKIDLDD